MSDLNAFPDAVGITIGSGTIRDGVHYIHSVSECQEQQRQAEYRRVRLEVAARLLAAPAPYQWTVAQSLAVADALIAANEAAPVPAMPAGDRSLPSAATSEADPCQGTREGDRAAEATRESRGWKAHMEAQSEAIAEAQRRRDQREAEHLAGITPNPILDDLEWKGGEAPTGVRTKLPDLSWKEIDEAIAERQRNQQAKTAPTATDCVIAGCRFSLRVNTEDNE